MEEQYRWREVEVQYRSEEEQIRFEGDLEECRFEEQIHSVEEEVLGFHSESCCFGQQVG